MPCQIALVHVTVVVSAIEKGLTALLAKYCGGQARGVDHIHILGIGLELACN